MNPICPNCNASDVEQRDKRPAQNGGVIFDYECPNCDERWQFHI